MAGRRRKRVEPREPAGELASRAEMLPGKTDRKGKAPGAGRALDAAQREKFEALLGADLSDVRLHEAADTEAHGRAALTRGRDVYFSPGAYAPEHPLGEKLLAHELAHAAQVRAGQSSNAHSSRDALEAEASAIASALSGGRASGELGGASAIRERADGATALFAEEKAEEVVPKLTPHPHQITPGHGQGRIQVGAASIGFRYSMERGGEGVELMLDLPKELEAQVSPLNEGELEIDDPGGNGARRIRISGVVGSGAISRVRAQLTSGAETLVVIFQFPA
jgi:Domain of unknown function (DUF4157)